jgi:hypothetical protein
MMSVCHPPVPHGYTIPDHIHAYSLAEEIGALYCLTTELRFIRWITISWCFGCQSCVPRLHRTIHHGQGFARMTLNSALSLLINNSHSTSNDDTVWSTSIASFIRNPITPAGTALYLWEEFISIFQSCDVLNEKWLQLRRVTWYCTTTTHLVPRIRLHGLTDN